MAGKGLIGTIILIIISLFIFGAIAPNAISSVNNGSTTLTAQGVSSTTIAVYGLIVIIAIVAIVMLYLKIGTG